VAVYTRNNGARGPRIRHALLVLTLLVLGGSVPILLDPGLVTAVSSDSPLAQVRALLPVLSSPAAASDPVAYEAIAEAPPGAAIPPASSTARSPRPQTDPRSERREWMDTRDIDFSSARMRFPPILTDPESIPRDVVPPPSPLLPAPSSGTSAAPAAPDFSQSRSLFHGDPAQRVGSGAASPPSAALRRGRGRDDSGAPAGAVPGVPGR
jgi:hypothetical protein